MQKGPRASFAWKLEEETVRFLILIHEIKRELYPLKFDKIKIKGDKLLQITKSW